MGESHRSAAIRPRMSAIAGLISAPRTYLVLLLSRLRRRAAFLRRGHGSPSCWEKVSLPRQKARMRRINERRAGAAQKRGGAEASVHGGAQPRCQIPSGGGLECSGWEKGGGIGVKRGRGGESRTRERERPASLNQTMCVRACVRGREGVGVHR